MKRIILGICALAALTSCHKDKTENEEQIKADRTVLVYVSGENSLEKPFSDGTRPIEINLNGMLEGSLKIGQNNLLAYIDRAKESELPYLIKIENGLLKDSVSIHDMGISENDEYTSDPQVMEKVIRYVLNKYPSKKDDYGLVLWGHASGWLIQDSIPYTSMSRRRAYGVDNGNNSTSDIGKWINIPTIAKVLSKFPKLSFIFADCCNFQCLETAYELRNVCDYIIGSPAEIPGVGAPYQTVVPAMFEPTTFYSSIVDKYYEQRADGYDVPLSAIKTSEMETLAQATQQILTSIAPEKYPDLSTLIYYYYDYSNHQEFYDANDFMLKYASDNEYRSWKQALDKAVVYKKYASTWMTNKWWSTYYSDFTMSEERYGGVSMFIPQYILQASVNQKIRQMGWYYAAGYDTIGW